MKNCKNILSVLLVALCGLTGYGETVTFKNVIYQPEQYLDYYDYWTVVGTTLTEESPDKNLYIVRGLVENDREIDDGHWAYKRFPREVFANNDVIENVYPYANIKNFYPWKMTSGWFCSKAFYNTKNLKSFEMGCSAPPGFPSEPADSVFMKSGVRVLKIHNCTKVGKSYAEATSNLDSCYIENIGSMAENAFKNSGLKVMTVRYMGQDFFPEGAFENSSLSDFTFPTDVIKHYRARSFKNTSIKAINLSNVSTIGDEVFSGVPLEEATWSASLTTIGKYAFRDTKLRDVCLSPAIESIGEGAFAGCENLTDVYISNPEPPVIVWDASDATRCTFPAGITIHVPQFAVEVYRNLVDASGNKPWASYNIVSLPKSADGSLEWESSGVLYRSTGGDVTVVGSTITADAPDRTLRLSNSRLAVTETSGYPFYYFDNTVSVELTFPEEIFSGNTIITGISGATVGNIIFDRQAFCESAVEQIIAGRTAIGEEAFCKTASLKKFEAASIREIGASAFENSAIREIVAGVSDGTENVSGSSAVGDESQPLHTIGARAFKNSSLEFLNARWPALTTIEEEAFSGTLLEDFEWGDRLAFIGKYAFAGTRLKQFHMPETLRNIEAGAFARCEQLTDVWTLTIEPPTIVWDDEDPDRCTFPPTITVHTLPSYVKFYQADAAWKHYRILGDGDVTAIGEIEGGDNSDVIRVEGGHIVADGHVDVYTIDGRLIASGNAGELPALSAGLYVVRTLTASAKVAIY